MITIMLCIRLACEYTWVHGGQRGLLESFTSSIFVGAGNWDPVFICWASSPIPKYTVLLNTEIWFTIQKKSMLNPLKTEILITYLILLHIKYMKEKRCNKKHSRSIKELAGSSDVTLYTHSPLPPEHLLTTLTLNAWYIW